MSRQTFCSFLPRRLVRSVVTPGLDVELGQAGLNLGPGPLAQVHANSVLAGGFHYHPQSSQFK